MINPKTGRRNPNNVKALKNFFPASSWMITQSRVPHANPKLPKVLVNGIDSRRSGIIQQIEINIFVVLLWLYISLLGKYTDMHLRIKHKNRSGLMESDILLYSSCSGFNFTSYLIIVTFNMFSRVIPRLACIANGKNWQKKLPTTQSLLTRSIYVNMSSL